MFCRRMVKRIYVPLPDNDARRALVSHLIDKHHKLSGKISPSSGGLVGCSSTETAIVDTESSKLSTLSQLHNVLTGNPRSLVPSKPTKPDRLLPVDDNDGGEIGERQLNRIVEITEGYSGSDLNAVSSWCFGFGLCFESFHIYSRSSSSSCCSSSSCSSSSSSSSSKSSSLNSFILKLLQIICYIQSLFII